MAHTRLLRSHQLEECDPDRAFRPNRPRCAAPTRRDHEADTRGGPLGRLRMGARRLLVLVAVLAMSSGGLGCSKAVKPEPFKAYATSVRQVQTGADESLGVAYSWSRESYLVRAAAPGSTAAIDLQLIATGKDPYGWKLPNDGVVLPWKIKQFRLGVERLNTSLVEYADLLASLASDELVSQQRFDQLATDLNDNAKSAAKALGSPLSDDQAALLSTAASELAKRYIEHKRKDFLAQALRENQAQIESAADLGRTAVRITATSLRKAYEDQSHSIGQKIAAASRLSEAQRRALVESLVVLDEQFVDQLKVLSALDLSYETLPKAHRELGESIESADAPLDQIRALYEDGKRLQRLYDQLRKSGDSDSSTAKPAALAKD